MENGELNVRIKRKVALIEEKSRAPIPNKVFSKENRHGDVRKGWAPRLCPDPRKQSLSRHGWSTHGSADQEVIARQQAETRAEAAEMEAARLRAELDRLRGNH